MFHCALTEFDTLEISVTTNGSSFVAQLPIGYDDETEFRYSALVAMESLIGYGGDTKELVFCLVEYDPETDALFEIWDGRETRFKIRDEQHRNAVMSAILQMTQALIDDVKPRVVSMVTHSANLPEKALTKYNRIAAIFHDAGYKAGKTDVWHGRHTWMMERC